mmetsp:Transcript_20427/g.36333  ORF Transcript_20427/g.36333 Transcript_20427/m.36333 type:complete len:208 (-) Transcript_20427:68-691(-)
MNHLALATLNDVRCTFIVRVNNVLWFLEFFAQRWKDRRKYFTRQTSCLVAKTNSCRCWFSTLETSASKHRFARCRVRTSCLRDFASSVSIFQSWNILLHNTSERRRASRAIDHQPRKTCPNCLRDRKSKILSTETMRSILRTICKRRFSKSAKYFHHARNDRAKSLPSLRYSTNFWKAPCNAIFLLNLTKQRARRRPSTALLHCVKK